MKKNVIKYLSISLGLIIVLIIYFSLIGIQTDRFNNQIKDRLSKYNSNLDVNLKKIKLTLDPLNFKFNAKTIGPKIIYKKRNIELESIKTQISINSLIKNKIISSNLIISTKSVLLKDLVGFLRATTNKTELFFLEKAIDKGFVIIDLEVNFDENGNIKKVQIYPKKSKAMNLAFDVTPAKYVTGLITEKGICRASEKGLKNLFK